MKLVKWKTQLKPITFLNVYFYWMADFKHVPLIFFYLFKKVSESIPWTSEQVYCLGDTSYIVHHLACPGPHYSWCFGGKSRELYLIKEMKMIKKTLKTGTQRRQSVMSTACFSDYFLERWSWSYCNNWQSCPRGLKDGIC